MDYRLLKYDNYNELEHSELSFYIDKRDASQNEDSYNVIKEALGKVGVSIDLQPAVNDNGKYKFSLKIDPASYLEANMRFAGPKKKGFRFPDNKFGLAGECVYYSDIVLLSQTMSDKEIMNALCIKFATFYRHKKAMLESSYYGKLDKNRLSDISYLKGAELAGEDNLF